MRSKRPGSLEGYWFRKTPPLAAQRMSQDLQSLSVSGAATTCIHALSARTAASSRRKLLIAMPFNASTRATITQCNGLRRIDAGIWVDVAAAVT
jgi:hypothetical protein